MTKEKEKKVSKDQLLLEASRLGQLQQLESILNQIQQIKSKKKTNPLASLRKTVGPNSVRDPVTGFTCLHHAALNGHSKCVQLILDHGAKLNAVDYKGSSALHLAAWAGNVEVVRILLSQQQADHYASSPPPVDWISSMADGQCRAQGGAGSFRQPPLGMAASVAMDRHHNYHRHLPNASHHQTNTNTTTGKQHSHASQIDIDLCNNDNQSPLSLAAQFGHSQVVAELLAHGADVQLRNSQMESPLDLACLNGRLETVDLLLRFSSALVANLRKPRATIKQQSLDGGGSSGFPLNHTGDLQRPSSMSVDGSSSSSAAARSTGTGTSPSGSGNRRLSGASAWSSLLRGRRDSSSTSASSAAASAAAASAPAGSQQQSPLHRFTAGTLSMRQRSPAATAVSAANQPAEVGKQGNQVTGSPEASSGPEASARDRHRRATLTVGASMTAAIGGQQLVSQQSGRQSSLDSKWSAGPNANQSHPNWTLEDQRMLAEATTAAAGKAATNIRQSPPLAAAAAAMPGERLLDHSPLHYAVRRGHSSVVNLLLGTYQANILQLTTMGSVLHEIALNNGKHSDMIRLLFSYIDGRSSGGGATMLLDSNQAQLQPATSNGGGSLRRILLDEFLNLKNSQQKNVFEVLNEINNRSAQEMKRLIYEFSEQVNSMNSPTKTTTTTTTSLELNRNNNLHYQQYQAIQQQQQQQQQQHQNQVQVAPSAVVLLQRQHQNQNNTQAFNCNKSNLEQFYSSQQQQQQAIQFSDSNKLDSFVTMKRIPKHKLPAPANNTSQPPNRIPDGTQTINRRPMGPSPLDPMGFNGYGYQQRQPEPFGQQQAVAMTRSVSNLSRGPSGNLAYGCHQDEPFNRQFDSFRAAGAPGAWAGCQQSWQISPDGVGAQLNSVNKPCDQEARRRRSRSRDLGSLLMEAQCRENQKAELYPKQQQQQQQVHAANELRLYDNSTTTTSSIPAGPPNHGATNQISSAAGVAQLVRSQTDCSHLMGRFFGDQSVCSSYSLAAGRGFHPAQQQQQQQQLLHHHQPPLQHTATLGRKNINRHYHVYEHEFYPPRLLQEGQKQVVAVVQPLGHQHHQLASEGGNSNLRASTRSSASSASTKSHPAPSRVPSVQASYSGNQYSNSRLSLNIEPPPRRPDVSVDVDQYQQQQLHMDRFLNRHSRKSQAPGGGGGGGGGGEGGAGNDGTDYRSASVDQSNPQANGSMGIQNNSRLTAEQQRQSTISNSISLESHLSEPHLFETTRKALLHDFDQMIGRELLNRTDHRQTTTGGVAGRNENSMLTGVMLDMDRRGDRLTVSGTRVIIPDGMPVATGGGGGGGGGTGSTSGGQVSSARRKISASSTDNHHCSPGPDERELLSNHSASPLSMAGSCNSNPQLGSQTGRGSSAKRDNLEGHVAPVAPPKPPRLSLLNKSASTNSSGGAGASNKREGSSSTQTAVIYDLPAGLRQEHSSGSTNQHTKRGHSQASRGQSLTGGTAAAAATPAQLYPTKAGKVGSSLTDPPNVRPPPLPLTISDSSHPQPQLSAPLRVEPSSGVGCCSSSSTGSGSISGGSSSSNNNNHHHHHHQEPIGLLKMASKTITGSNSSLVRRTNRPPPTESENLLNGAVITQTSIAPTPLPQQQQHQQQQQQPMPVAPMDPDSGVCTSNSPASMSHDSEEQSNEQDMGEAVNKRLKQTESAVVRHLARASQRTPVPLEVSPPSPKTAQLCIEEALMPLAKAQQTSEAANQTSGGFENCSQSSLSPRSSCLSEPLVKWPDIEQQQYSSKKSDYENCQLLQRQLQLARCQSINELLNESNATGDHEPPESPALLSSVSSASSSSQKSPSCSSSSATELADEEEEDYAQSAASMSDAQSSGSSSSSPEASETCHRGIDDEREQDKNGTNVAQRKEVLLKVVVDENDRTSNGDEVFYMNPSELKKIAMKRSQADAGTLTDEELCAAIDKESGYIRFTLRKRRNNTIQNDDHHDGPKLDSLPDNSKSSINHHSDDSSKTDVMEQEPPIISSGSANSRFKKTKLISASDDDHKLRAADQAATSGGGDGDRSLGTSKDPIRSTSNQQVQASTTGTNEEPSASVVADSQPAIPRHDMNNNSSSLLARKESAASMLKSWFAAHLAGLVEYSDKFLENGFDDLRFLNNPKLLNEQLLASIGIGDESHRTLIMDRISKELPALDFGKLDLVPTETTGGGEAREGAIKLSSLSLNIDPNHFKAGDLDSLKNASEHLPLGHRVRLLAALEFVAPSSLRLSSDLQLVKASSADDAAADVDTMDIASQASASSSSSKESIASIVSLSSRSACTTTSANPPPNEAISVVAATEQPQSLPEEPVKPQAVTRIGESSPDDRPSANLNSLTSIKSNRWSGGSVTKSNGAGGGSLVSEVARKLEAVAAQTASENPRANLKPVAAARRINCKPLEPVDRLSNLKNTTVAPEPKGPASEPQASPTKVRKTFVPVKSICWPPKNNHQDTEMYVNREVNKLNASRSTFQRRLEDKAKSSEGSEGPQQVSEANAGNKQRPKPAPPAKPAKLVGPKFNIDLSQRL